MGSKRLLAVKRAVDSDGHLYNMCWDWLAYAKFCRKTRAWAAKNVVQSLALRGITKVPSGENFSAEAVLYAMRGMRPEPRDILLY